MEKIEFQIVAPTDQRALELIADWYFSEWHIPAEATIKRLQKDTAEEGQFQVLMTLNGSPISTGGLYDHVGILDKEPRLKMHKKWLALVYTIPGKRGKGYGAEICNFIQEHAKNSGFNQIHLFTDSAERLYHRLGWAVSERMVINNRNIVVMAKELTAG